MTRAALGPLASLEARRAFGSVALPTLVFLGVAAWGAGRDLAPLESVPSTALARAGLWRERLWTTALAFTFSLALLQAAGVSWRWRAGEADWLGSRPISRTAACATAWIAITGVGIACLGLAGGLVEARYGAGGPTWRFAGRSELSSPARVAAAESKRLELPFDPTEALGGRLRMRAAVAVGGGRTAEVDLKVLAGGAESVESSRFETRTWIEVSLPEGRAERLEVELVNHGPADVVVFDDPGVEVWVPVSSAGAASRALLSRSALALAAGCALAIALGCWISRVSAALLVVALWLAVMLASGSGRLFPAWIPGVDLPRAVAIAGEGRVPAVTSFRPLLGGAALVLAAWGLACAGLRSWRHPR